MKPVRYADAQCDTGTTTPIYKVGAVIIRFCPMDTVLESGEIRPAGEPEFFIMRTQPKDASDGSLPPFALPRGSRQYYERDENGKKHYRDARDAKTAMAHADRLESLPRALLREVYEEAGIPRDVQRSNDVVTHVLGVRSFASRSKPPYDVQWYIMQPNARAQARMLAHPKDTIATKWATMSEIEALIASHDFSPGYLPVLREAVQAVMYEQKHLQPIGWPVPSQSR